MFSRGDRFSCPFSLFLLIFVIFVLLSSCLHIRPSTTSPPRSSIHGEEQDEVILSVDGVHPFTYVPTQLDWTVETYPDLGGKYTRPMLPPSREGHCAVTCGSDCMLVFSGEQLEGGVGPMLRLMDLWEFTVSKKEWNLVNVQGFELGSATMYDWVNTPGQASFPGSRVAHRCTRLEKSRTRFRMMMGSGYPVEDSSSVGLLNDVWEFDMASRSWTFRSIASGSETWKDKVDSVAGDVLYPAGRRFAQLWVLGDDAFLMGGENAVLPILWKFVDSSGQWTILKHESAGLPYCMHRGITWSDHSSLFMYGGHCDGYLNTFFAFNVSTLEWTDLSTKYSIPLSRRIGGPADTYQSSSRGRLVSFVAGGRYNFTTYGKNLADCWLFDADDGWMRVNLTSTQEEQSFPPLFPGPEGRYFGENAYWPSRVYHSLVVVGSTAVLYGGIHDRTFTGPGWRVLSDVWMMSNLQCVLGSSIESPQSDLCSGHGICFDEFGACVCEQPYSGPNCTDLCNSTMMCFGHGQCVRLHPLFCTCQLGYLEPTCSAFGCNGIIHSSPAVCSQHGECVQDGSAVRCVCDELFGGSDCDVYDCQNTENQDICGPFGQCSFTGTHCECQNGYYLSKDGVCDRWKCFDIWANDPGVCSSRGSCVSPNVCLCDARAFGSRCQTLIVVVVVGVVGAAFVAVVLCVITVAVFVFLFLKLRRKGAILEGLRFHLLEDDSFTIGEVDIDRGYFAIDSEELQLVRRLGAGASGSVFLAKWKSMDVAVKTFRFDTFDVTMLEKEIKIMSLVSHPSIVRFFGAALWPPRCCIVLEFCSNGDLEAFLQHHSDYPVASRLDMCRDIASGLAYMHRMDVLHRDLKPRNIFVTENEEIRIGDFGLSRVILTRSQTGQIGTSIFMAPEMTLGKVYDSSVDVFAFSIVVFEVLSQDFQTPYEREGIKSVTGDLIHFRIASDCSFRPDLSRLDGKEELEWVRALLPRMWAHEPSSRPSSEEVLECFVLHQQS